MIQEKDFLYRVPVKTAPITTPGGQIRNPEILVDVEGGEFMHGNILDANSTNKLINQSVKDAVDNKLNESGYLTKDLLEAETTRATEQENSLKTLIGAETSARTKGDEDLSSKIKAEQTRAEGKEKEISDKLAIVNGDSNTEGSFRKAIADVVAAAPEDLDTLKEIADKLAGNDDLHTALNQAIATKADATALSNYVLTTALNKQVDTLNTAISAKQDAGNYITFEKRGLNDDYCYIIAPSYYIECRTDKFDNGKYNYSHMSSQHISVYNSAGNGTSIDCDGIVIDDGGDASADNKIMTIGHTGIKFETNKNNVSINENGFFVSRDSDGTYLCSFTPSGIRFEGQTASDIPNAGGGFIELNSLASAEDISSLRVGLSKKHDKITVNEVDITDIETADITKLRTIVTNLINALSASGLIRETETIE